MSNPYVRHLKKIEFAVTYACTGKCKHCSEGDHAHGGERIDPTLAADVVHKVARSYNVETVMVFGGEPLLHADAVCAIMRAAVACGVLRRQVITNGYASKDRAVMRSLAERLAACGVNDLLLSVDAFHQETIPLEDVKAFASEAVRCGIPVRLSPAWLVSPDDDNPYNRETRALLGQFADLAIPVGAGNVVFPEGNAVKYLAEYFASVRPENPYVEDPRDVRCLSISPNGDTLGVNLYQKDVLELLREYAP
jgi:pyruvate-formate lyase-activating enzyme